MKVKQALRTLASFAVLVASCLMATGAAAQIGKLEPMDKPIEGGGGWPYTVVEIPGFTGDSRLGELTVDEDGTLYAWAVRREVRADPGANSARESIDPPEPPGGGGVPVTTTSTLLAWNGETWSTALQLEGEVAASIGNTGRDVYATTTTSDGAVHMYRFNGKRWLRDRLPDGVQGPVGMIVGDRNDVFFRSGPAVYTRHDRGVHSESAPGEWVEVLSVEHLAYGSALAFVSRNEVYAPCCQGQMMWNGSTWTWQPSDPADIHGAWAGRDAAGILHLFKAGSAMSQDGPCVWSYQESSPFNGSYEMVLHDDPLGLPVASGHMTHMWGADVHDVLAAGTYFGEGMLYGFDGVQWSKHDPLPGMPAVTGLAGTRAGEAWIGLADGRLLHHASEESSPRPKRSGAAGAQSVSIAPRDGGVAISFSTAIAGEVTVSIHDLAGRRLATLESGWRSPGDHEVRWNAAGFGPSVYFARVQTGDAVSARSFVLLR